jgi:hypothetical protein
MSSKKRKSRKKNATPAAMPRKRRRHNPAAAPTRKRRRTNPAAFGKRDLVGYGSSLLVGGLVGVVSAGADKMLDPKLVASGWKRGLIDIGAGAALGLLGAAAGMPVVAHAAIAGGAALGAARVVNSMGDPQATIDRAKAVIAFQTDRAKEKGLPVPNPYSYGYGMQGQVAGAPRSRLLPTGQVMTGTGSPAQVAQRVAR